MKLILFGTSRFAIPSFEALKRSRHNISMVVTQPDRRGGRHLRIIESPVKRWANENNYTLYQPQNDLEIRAILERFKADLFVVIGYGRILPPDIIDIPKYYSINIHPSLLPKYRGAAPINWAIINGERETGVTIFKLSSKMDAGEIILQRRIEINPDDTNLTLDKRLSEIGADMLIEALKKIEDNQIDFKPQDDRLATYAPKLKKEDGLIDWSKDSKRIYNLIRGTQGWPGAFTFYKGKRLKIFKVEIVDREECKERIVPGEVVDIKKDDGIIIKTGRGYLSILNLQIEAKKRMSAQQFILGSSLKVGDILGQ